MKTSPALHHLQCSSCTRVPLCCSACTSPVPHAAFTDSSQAVPSLKLQGWTFQCHCQTEKRRERERRERERRVRGKVRCDIWGNRESGSETGEVVEKYWMTQESTMSREVKMPEYRKREWGKTEWWQRWHNWDGRKRVEKKRETERQDSSAFGPCSVTLCRDEDNTMNRVVW